MIVPANRLLAIVAFIFFPCAVLIATAPTLVVVAAAICLAVVILAVADAVFSRRRLDAVRIELPSSLRLVKNREAEFDIRIHYAPKRLRIGLIAPPSLHAQEEAFTEVPQESEACKLPWRAQPAERGAFTIDTAMLESSSRLGLWSIRAKKPVSCEMRVYPNLMSDKAAAASLLLNRGTVGVHVQPQVGKGREFEKLREYLHGDTYDDISWRATARRGIPVTKVYQVERTQEVYAVIDCSRLTGRRINDEPVLERFLVSALLLGLAVENEGDHFGIAAFDDRLKTIVRAGAGRAHFGVCRDAMYPLKPRLVSPDFRELSRYLRTSLRKRALLVFLTDLDDTVIAEDFLRNIGVLRRNHLILAGMMQPPGVEPLFSNENVETSDDIIDRLGGHLRWHKLAETQRKLRAQGVTLTMSAPDKFASNMVRQYRSVKARQLL